MILYKLAEAFEAQLQRDDLATHEVRAQAAALAAVAMTVLDEQNYHGPGDCPECEERHWSALEGDTDLARLSEAVQMLHAQAHNEPSDTLTAIRCHREPCRTVGGGLVLDADARSAFTPGSRVA